MKNSKRLPEVQKVLVDHLDEVFPLTAFKAADTLNQLVFLQGIEAVKDHLKAIVTSQLKS